MSGMQDKKLRVSMTSCFTFDFAKIIEKGFWSRNLNHPYSKNPKLSMEDLQEI